MSWECRALAAACMGRAPFWALGAVHLCSGNLEKVADGREMAAKERIKEGRTLEQGRYCKIDTLVQHLLKLLEMASWGGKINLTVLN